MTQEIKIIITDFDGKVFSEENQYSQYTFDSQYGTPADAFSITLVERGSKIRVGYGIQFLVNGIIEFNGIIQRRESIVEKTDYSVRLTGKDRASILVENNSNKFSDFSNTHPTTIIDSLIDQTNFYTKEKGSVDSQTDSTGFNSTEDLADLNTALVEDVDENNTLNRSTDITVYDTDFTRVANRGNFKINVGNGVYQKIEELVISSGYEILYQENGELYIGDLNKKRYNDTTKYEIKLTKSGKGNNALSARLNEDISGQYSSICVVSQSEGWDGKINTTKVATNSLVPLRKYMAVSANNTEENPGNLGIRIREDQRISGFQPVYVMPGHVAGNGESYRINRYANVFDEINDIRETLVIYGRTFTFSDVEGSRTILRLSYERRNELNI